MGHFTVWISLSLSGIATYTHMPQGVILIIMGIYMSSNIYYYDTKGERSDADQ